MSDKGPDFDGVYLLKENLPEEKPHELCADSCLYTKLDEPDEDFCFQQFELSEGANVVCEAENITSTIQPTTINIEIQVERMYRLYYYVFQFLTCVLNCTIAFSFP